MDVDKKEKAQILDVCNDKIRKIYAIKAKGEVDGQQLDWKGYCCKDLAHDFVIGAPACYTLGIVIELQEKSEIYVRNQKQVATVDVISMDKKKEQVVEK
jgi:hypothetical protein